jgi:hypothetical protein
MSSVRAGIEALEDDPAAIVVALADQPAPEPADVDFRRTPSWLCRSPIRRGAL